jgi:hypothetical protein
MNEFFLPHEIFDRSNVPDNFRDQVQAQILAAKYCALVEAAMEVTGGEPITMSLERCKQILTFTHLTDPRSVPVIAEDPAGDQDHVLVRLATLQEKQAANRRYALHRMGGRRN